MEKLIEAGENTYLFIDDNGDVQICINSHRYLNSLGLWLGDNPLNYVVPVTVLQLILFAITYRVIFFVLRRIHISRFICKVLAGILLGPTLLGRQLVRDLYPAKQAPLLITLDIMSVVFFVFILALKMDILTTLRGAKHSWRFGVIPFAFSIGVIGLLTHLYKPNDDASDEMIENLPNVFSMSSFAVVSEALLELNLITTELGQIALSSAMIGEIMQWIALLVETSISFSIKDVIAFLFSCLGFMLFCVFVVRPVARVIMRKTPTGKPVKEMYVAMILLGALISAVVSDLIGLSYMIGPMFYGLVIPNGPPLATTIVERCEVAVLELLLPFFFLHVGIKTHLNAIELSSVALTFQGIVLAGVVVKLLACMLVAPTYKIKVKHGFVLGLILNIKGIMELILFSQMEHIKVMDESLYSHVVLYTVLITSVCTILIKWFYKDRPRVSKAPSILTDGQLRTIQNTREALSFNIISCVHTDKDVHSMIALLEAFNPTQESPLFVHIIHLIELLGKSTPALLPLNTQNKKLLSINYPNTNHIMRAFTNFSTNSNGPVTVFSYINVAPYNSMHDAVCHLAEDKFVPFIVVPFHETDHMTNRHMSVSIHDLNDSLQSHARCTVGILVDKYCKMGISSSNVSLNMAILFIGGCDDREALALGIRMLERANTKVTLFRFILVENDNNSLGEEVGQIKVTEEGEEQREEVEEEDEEEEGVLDNSLVDEFKAKRLSYGEAVVCNEITVEDRMENVLGEIRNMGNELYDLMMVGKRHSVGNLTDEEMTGFMDNADQLGVIGDMLASTEFCDGRVPLLVIQRGEKRVKNLQKQGSHVSSIY